MNIDGPDLEDRYRRVLRLLPGYYRSQWEDDMVAAFLDSQVTGDEAADEYALEFGRPAWPEVAPLGPDASPRPVHLRFPIILEALRVQFPRQAEPKLPLRRR
jgi:hypothetical protein